MPVFNGFDKVTVEAMVWTGTPTAVALAVVLDQVRLDEVLEQILGMSDIPMAWFSEMTLSKYSLSLFSFSIKAY